MFRYVSAAAVEIKISLWKAIMHCFSCIFSSLSPLILSHYFPNGPYPPKTVHRTVANRCYHGSNFHFLPSPYCSFMRFLLSFTTDTFPFHGRPPSQNFSVMVADQCYHWSNSHFLPSPDCSLLSSPATTTPFQNFAKTTTYRTMPVREQNFSPLSLLLSKRRLKTQTLTDLSLYCYHYRKTQQIRAGKGHTSERLVSTCLIFINFV